MTRTPTLLVKKDYHIFALSKTALSLSQITKTLNKAKSTGSRKINRDTDNRG